MQVGDKFVRGKLSREITAITSSGREIHYKNQSGKISSCWISTWESWVRKADKAEKPESPFRLLQKALLADPEYAWSWHCNLACGMQDEGVSYEQSNRAAARLMRAIFGARGYEPTEVNHDAT